MPAPFVLQVVLVALLIEEEIHTASRRSQQESVICGYGLATDDRDGTRATLTVRQIAVVIDVAA